MIRVVFTEDFAGYKNKETAELESTLASRLIKRKVAKLYKKKKSK